MTDTLKYADAQGAANNFHLYEGEYPPLYEFLVFTQNDIINNNKLLTDAEYCQDFLDSFNTKELWSSEAYINIAQFIIDELPAIEYPQTIKALNNYGIIANSYNRICSISDRTEIVEGFTVGANDRAYIDPVMAFEAISEYQDQTRVDNQLYKMVSNCSSIKGYDQQFIHLIYQLQSKFKPASDSYYLSFIDNIMENHVIFSKEFLVTYLKGHFNTVLSYLKNVNYEMYQYYNCLTRMTKDELCYNINDLFDDIVTKFSTVLIKECRQVYVNTQQAYIKMGIQPDSEVELINNIISEIDAYSIISNCGKLENILKTKELLPINKEAVNSVLSSINDDLFTNGSPTEVENLTRVLQYSKDESKSGYVGNISNTIGSVMSSLTPEVMHSPSASIVKQSYSKLSDQVKVTSSTLTADNDDYLNFQNSVQEKIGFINNQVAQTLNTHAIGIDVDLDFLDSVNNLKYELGLYDNFLGEQLCALKNLLCIANKIYSFVTSGIDSITDIIKDSYSDAKNLMDKLESGLKAAKEKKLAMELSSKVNELISNKMDDIKSQVANLVGDDVAEQLMSCYSSNSNSIANSLLSSSTISTVFNNFASDLYNNLQDEYKDAMSSNNCKSSMRINGINIPSLSFSGLDFNLPEFTLKLLNCK